MVTFGALHAESRQLVGRLIKKAIKANPFADASRTASAIWRAVSAAAVGRAAKQLAKTAEYDSPLGLDVRVLDNLTPCPLRDAEEAGSTCDDATDDADVDMGTSSCSRPSPVPAPAALGRVPPNASASRDRASAAMDSDPEDPDPGPAALRIRVRPPRAGCPPP